MIERRKFSRIPIPRDQAETVLVVRKKPLEVRLIDASPVGFAVVCPAAPQVDCGAHVQLLLPSGWVEVRVVRTSPLDTGETLLGFARVRDLLTDPLAEHWLAGFGGRYGMWSAALALSAGLLIGVVLLTRSEGNWSQVWSAVASLSKGGW